MWKPSDNSIQYVSHIQLATDENLPSVDDKEARIGIVEGEEEHRVVNEVPGNELHPDGDGKVMIVFPQQRHQFTNSAGGALTTRRWNM